MDGTMVDGTDLYHDAIRRIDQLERLNKVLSAEIDLMRPIIEACQLAKRNGLIGPNSGFTVSKIYHAVVAYEAAKERG